MTHASALPGAEPEQNRTEAAPCPAVAPRERCPNHHGEGAVASAEKNGSVAALDQGAGDCSVLFDAPRYEELACREDLVEGVDDLIVHPFGVAVDDDGDSVRGDSAAPFAGWLVASSRG